MNIEYIDSLFKRNRYGTIMHMLDTNVHNWSIKDYRDVYEYIIGLVPQSLFNFINNILPIKHYVIRSNNLMIKIPNIYYDPYNGGIEYELYEIMHYIKNHEIRKDIYYNCVCDGKIYTLGLKYMFSKENMIKYNLSRYKYQIMSLNEKYLDFMTSPRIMNTIRTYNDYREYVGHDQDYCLTALPSMKIKDLVEFVLKFKLTKYYDILFDNKTFEKIMNYDIEQYYWYGQIPSQDIMEQLEILKNIFAYHYKDGEIYCDTQRIHIYKRKRRRRKKNEYYSIRYKDHTRLLVKTKEQRKYLEEFEFKQSQYDYANDNDSFDFTYSDSSSNYV